MIDFESKRIANSSGESAEERPTDPLWAEWDLIKRTSVMEFAKTCARLLHAKGNWPLTRKLCDMVLTNGREPVVWAGVTYTGPMMLDLYRRA